MIIARPVRWTPKTGQPDKMAVSPVGRGRSGGPEDDEEASGFWGGIQGEGGVGGLPRRENNGSIGGGVWEDRKGVRNLFRGFAKKVPGTFSHLFFPPR